MWGLPLICRLDSLTRFATAPHPEQPAVVTAGEVRVAVLREPVLGNENYLSSSRMRFWSVVFAGAPELALLVSTSNASYYY